MDTHELNYQLFLAEQYAEQAELEMYINESIIISEGTNTFDNIDIIHESFVDKIKEAIKKFLQAIANMWHKFTESMDTLLKTDKAYLEKYKDIILKKQPIESTYSIHDYFDSKNKGQGTKLLLNSPVPMINLNNMDSELESEEKFLSVHFQKFIQGAKAPYNLSDLAKAKFRGNDGEEIEYEARRFNMTDLYNYCYNYKKLADLIEKDIQNLQKTTGDILMKVDKMVRDGAIKNESALLYGEKQYLSTVYEAYVHEAMPTRVEKNDNNNVNTNNNQSGHTSHNSQQNNNNSQQNTRVTNPAQAYKKTEKGDSNQEINSEKTAKELSEKAKLYLKVCGGFLGAKQSVAEETYKAYMSIIKAHVRDHVGKKDDKKDNKPVDKASDQSKPNNNEKKNNSQDNNNQEQKSSTIGSVSDFFKDIFTKK